MGTQCLYECSVETTVKCCLNLMNEQAKAFTLSVTGGSGGVFCRSGPRRQEMWRKVLGMAVMALRHSWQ